MMAEVFHLSPMVIVISRQEDGKIIEVNASYEKLFGYRQEEVVGKTPDELGIFLEPASGEQAFNTLESKGVLRDQELDVRTKSGLLRHVSISTEPFVVNNESFQLIVLYDLTERDQMAAALKISESKYRNLVESLNEGVCWINADVEVEFANAQMAQMVGYTIEEAIGQPIHKFLDEPNYLKALQVKEERSFGKPGQTEYELIRKDGKKIPVLVSSKPLYDPQGIFLGVVAGIIDITERRRTEEELHQMYSNLEKLVHDRTVELKQSTHQLELANRALEAEIVERTRVQAELRASKDLFEQLFESGPAPTLLINRQRAILRANNQAVKRFGYSLEELINQPVEILLPERFQHKHSELMETFYANPTIRPIGLGLDLYLRCKDGSEMPVDITLSPATIGDQLQVICVIHDLTTRKQMEAEVSELQRRLMDQVEAERLHLAQDLHDGPMQEIYGLMYRIAKLSEPISEKEKEQEISEVQARLQEINTVLRAITRDLRPPTLTPYGLEKAIREHSERFQVMHTELELSLDLTADGINLPEAVRLALFRIYQVALINVVRHAQASRVDVRFYYNDHQVVLEVQDNGRGFTPPTRWINFARKGHLGLVGALERAEAIGGNLVVDSGPGKGTRIRVVVPRIR